MKTYKDKRLHDMGIYIVHCDNEVEARKFKSSGKTLKPTSNPLQFMVML